MDNVSFTGIRNIGSYTHIRRVANRGSVVGTSLIAKFEDDVRGNDLSEYTKVLQKCSDPDNNYEFPKGNGYLHIKTETFYPDYEDFTSIHQLSVNGKPVPPSTRTMPLFTYIAKITNRIQNMSDKDYRASGVFRNGRGYSYLTESGDYSLICSPPEEYRPFIDRAFSLKEVKKGSALINNDIQKQMIDYFG